MDDKEQIFIDVVNKLTQLVQGIENVLEDVKFSRKLILKEANDALAKIKEADEHANETLRMGQEAQAKAEAAAVPAKKTK